MEDLISVIITTYKREMSILKRAIDTVLCQEYTNIELIIVNDYPPYKNKVENLIEKNYINKNVKVIHNEKNKGACFSRNEGLSYSSGKYIAFLDDDDEWDKSKLREEKRMLNDDIGMVYCSGYNIFSSGKKEKISFIKEYSKEKQLEELLKTNYMGGCSFPLIKREVLNDLGGFDQNLPASQDFDLWIRITEKYKTLYIDKPLVLYHIMEDSITRDYKKRVMGYMLVLSKHKRLYNIYPKSAVHIYNSIITVYIEHKKYFRSILPFFKSFKYFPYNLSILLFWLNILFKKISIKYHGK